MEESTKTVVTSITTDAETYREFKTICTSKGIKIKDAINALILGYVKKHK